MLISSLYTAEQISHTDALVQMEVRYNGSHPIYAGHFPGQPVTPGVCLIHTATELLSKAAGRVLRLSGARQIKFLQMHTPTMPLRFDLAWSQEDAGLRGRIAIFQNDRCIAKIDAQFESL